MVPMVRMDILNRVVGPTLEEAYCGWGEAAGVRPGRCFGHAPRRGPEAVRSHGAVALLRPPKVLYTPVAHPLLHGSAPEHLLCPSARAHPLPRPAAGLDIVWPFLLGYPKDSVAVIDSICAFHPVAQLDKVSTYGFRNPKAR